LIARPLLPSLPSGLHPIAVLSIEGGEQGTRCPAGRRWGRRALGRCSRRSTTTTRGAPAALTTGKDLLRGKPYKEFLYVWMVSLTAGTHFSSLHRPLFQLLLLSGDFSLELVTLDNLNDHMLQ